MSEFAPVEIHNEPLKCDRCGHEFEDDEIFYQGDAEDSTVCADCLKIIAPDAVKIGERH